MIERVCIVGGGSIGSIFAAHLATVAEVSMLTRRREHAEALAADQLAPDEWLVAPRGFLPAGIERTLDDVPRARLDDACDGRLVLADGLGEALTELRR